MKPIYSLLFFSFAAATWFFSIYPIVTAADISISASGACALKDCVYSEWTLWSDCTHECGEHGVRTRARRLLSSDQCKSTCNAALNGTERCNVRCCPRNCVYSDWEPWFDCHCSEKQCEQVGHRYVCLRFRRKKVKEACGGFCDDILLEKRCGNPCCYRDCVLGSWARWSDCHAPCEQPGVRYRNRTLNQEPKCGGKRCHQHGQHESCQGGCCPVDCVQGPWSAWSRCPATCGSATVTRTRFVQSAGCGGLACSDESKEESKECQQYNDVHCKVSPWSVWGECNLLNGKCGNGTRTRSRDVLVAAYCKGAPCPSLLETGPCTGPCCLTDCGMAQWSAFGHCSTTCGQGKRNSTRKAVVQPSCGGRACPLDLLKYEDCVVEDKTDCRFTAWAPWSSCSNHCGKGQATRTRTLLTPAYCGGICHSLTAEESRACESHDAKADCQVGPWAAWSNCVRDCDVGVTTRKRVIISNDVCGGVACSTYNLTESKGCHARCSQLCNQAVCSCRPGFLLAGDKVKCNPKACPPLHELQYCGHGTMPLTSCFFAHFKCEHSVFGDKCAAICPRNWIVKGGDPHVSCLETGQWNKTTIFCGKTNKAPLNITVSKLEVSELLKPDQCFAELKTQSDNEPWDRHTYTVVKDASSNMKVKDDHLCCIRSFDFETSGLSSWKTTVRSTDLDGLHVDREFTFTLLNENDPPRSVQLVPDTVPENSKSGTVVGCLQGVDDDPGQVLSYFIVKSLGKMFELFHDASNETCVRVSKESDPRCYTEGGTRCLLNYEKQSSFYIAIMAQDNGTPPLANYFDISIKLSDVNEPISAVSMKPASIPESIKAGKPLARLVAVDEDRGQKHTFRLLQDATGLFRTDGQILSANQTFDYEQDPSRQFLITVEVTDDGTPPMKAQKVLAFGVGDKNESPYNLGITAADRSDRGHLVLRENSLNTVIGTVTVFDPDAGDSITLTLSTPKFTLRNQRCTPLKGNVYNYCSAQLLNVQRLDFETTPNLTLTVFATDDNFHRIQKDFPVEVLDQNDPPTDILVSGGNSTDLQVREHQPGRAVGRLEVVDEDRHDTHTIFLAGAAAPHFTVTNGTLYTSAVSSLDYEKRTDLSLVMTAIDSGRPGQTVVKTFTVNVTDINEHPAEIRLSGRQVVENSPANTVVANLSAVDPDNAVDPRHQNFTFRLLDDAGGRFRVAEHRLLVSPLAARCLSARCSLNHEVLADLLVKVQVTDSGLPPLSLVSTFVVSVTDANDPPKNVRLSRNTVRENKPPQTLVGTIMADDEDALDTFTFALLNGTDVFSIQNKDRLVTSKELNYERNKTFVLGIRVTDNGTPPSTAESTVTVVVEDAPEPPVFVTSRVMTAVENAAVGSAVGVVLATDPDRNDHLDIVLRQAADAFLLGPSNCTNNDTGMTCNATLMTSVVLEFEKRNKYELEVIASDGQGHSVVTKVTVNVKDTNDPPSDVLLNGTSAGTVRVREGAADLHWTLTVVEQDTGQSHNVTVSSQQGHHLAIEGNVLKVVSPYDHETEAESVVVLTVVDDGQPPRSLVKPIKILVDNVNEDPTGLSISANKVPENSPGGTVVGRLQGSDPETAQTLTYSLQDDAGQRFSVQGDKLVVKDNGKCGGRTRQPCRLNFEAKVSHNVTVMVTDNGSPRKHATFVLVIEVTDVNDAPHDLTISNHSVAELSPAGTLVGTVEVVDEDRGQRHDFSLLHDSGGLFRMGNNGTVVRATAQRLDAQRVYNVTVKAVDNGVPPAEVEETFYLSVSGVSEAPQVPQVAALPPVTMPSPGVLLVPENVTAATHVAVVSSVDKDPGSKLTFKLLEDGQGHFVLSESASCEAKGGDTQCSVSLTVKTPLDFETRQSHQLLVQVTDPDKMQSTLPLTVIVVNVNEPPQSVVFVTGRVQAEENAGGLTLGTFTAPDPDAGDSHTFTITSDRGNKFTLTPQGLLATAKGPGLDYEEEHQHAISVQATDSAGNKVSRDFNVTVVDVNERPVNLTLHPNSAVAEMSPAETVVGHLSVSDPDNEGKDGVVQTFTFSILSEHGDRFYVDGDRLKVKSIGGECTLVGGVACLLDYESKANHSLIIAVTDSGNPPIKESLVLVVHVSDVNDPPAPPTLDTRTVSEAALVGSVVGQLSSSDQDRNQAVHFDVVGEGAALFSVQSNTLVLAHKLDHEDRKQVEVHLQATDNGVPPLFGDQTITITVEDVNEAPTEVTIVTKPGGAGVDFAADRPIVMEDTARGAAVAQLVVLDPDLQDEMTVLLSDQAVVGVGSMSCLSLTKGTRCVGDVTLSRELNYEAKMTWIVDVTVVDSGGKKLEKTFNVTVGDTNDKPQMLLINGKAISNISVPENSQGVTLATLGAVDPDANQTHSFTVPGTTLFTIAGDKLQVSSAATLDFEEKKVYTVKVKVTDTGRPPMSMEKDVVIHVTDVNEAPTEVKLSINKFDEDILMGKIVAHFVTSDPDNVKAVTQTHTYVLTDDAEGRFVIYGENLLVKDAKFDFETKPSHSIGVTVTDSGTPPLSAPFTLTLHVLDANDPPFNLRLVNASSIPEDRAVGSVVARLAADDMDGGQTVRYSIQGPSQFVVSGASILVDGSLDFEIHHQASLTIVATDTGTPPKSISKTFSLDITDVNEEPSTVNLTSSLPHGGLAVSEKTQVDDVIGLLTSYDPDAVDYVSISVTPRSDPRLKLAGKGTVCHQIDVMGALRTKCSVHVQLATALNYEVNKEDMRLEVKAMDKGGLGKTEGWTLTVANSNDKPTAITIEGNRTEIPENEESFVIGGILCSDPDPGDSHTFQLLTGWDLFKVAKGGVLTLTKPLNYERQRGYEVMVRCSDSGQPAMSVTEVLHFSVKNVNEKPTHISLSHTEVAMTAAKDSIVAFLEVTDPDNVGFVDTKQKHVCKLNDDQDVFYVDGDRNTLRVKDKVPANEHMVSFTITCVDNGVPPLSLSKKAQLLVAETADVPKEVRLENATHLKENEPAQVLGRLVVVNLLSQAPVSGTYTCSKLTIKETNDTVLAIEGQNLVTKQPLDFEVTPFLTVTLTCAGRDLKNNTATFTSVITVKVGDVNEAPTEIRVYGGGAVEENSGPGTLVARLNTLDPEPHQNYTYTIMAVAAGIDPNASDPTLLGVFAVEGRTLTVGPKAQLLNHEATPLFSLTVRSTDDGQPPLSVTATIRVEVKDVNEAPTKVALDKSTVSENSAVNSVVGRLSVRDEDKGQTHTCQVNNLKDVPFTVKNKLDLVVSRESIDYEKTRTYIVKVTCQDEGDDDTHLRVTTSLRVNVTDVNEAPYDVRLSTESVAENSPAGQVVGEIMATDPDSKKVTFSLVDGSDHFKIEGDNTLAAVKTFDHDVLTSVPVSVRATDDQGLTTVKKFIIKIEDMNDPPTSLSLSDHVVSESTPPGGLVAQLVTEDPDRGQTFTFVLSPDPAVDGHLAVSGDNLVVGTLGLDYETAALYQVKVTALDSGTPSLNITREFNITVTDSNEAPTDIVTTPISPVPENVGVPHVLTSLLVIDQERKQRHSCHLLTSHGPLAVDTQEDGNMTLVVQRHLDYETARRYDVTVSCSDGEFDVTKNLSVHVTDVNEAPTRLVLSGPQALPAAFKGEHRVGVVSVLDPDPAQRHTLVIRGVNSDLLTIRSGNTLVLIKSVPASILASPAPEVRVSITATDNGQPPLSLQQSFSLSVTDVDLKELQLPRIVLNNSRVKEDAAAGTEIGAVYDLNKTVSDTVVFTVLKDDQNLFQIRDNKELVLSRDMATFTGRAAEVTLQARNTRTGETAQREVTVLVTRSDRCYRDGSTCDQHARCLPLNDTASRCQCDPDFKGDGYACQQVDDCVQSDGSSPCRHGTCVDDVLHFRCSCHEGFTGPLCEMEPNKADPCAAAPCGARGACVPDRANTSFTCTCGPGWRGPRCQASVDDCLAGLCHGASSTCVDRHLAYLCTCSQDRFGPRCEYLKSACPEGACGNTTATEVCSPTPESAEHTCVDAARVVRFMLDCKKAGIAMETCGVRFLTFARTFGRFQEHASKQNVKRVPRLKVAASASAPYTPGVHVYPLQVQEMADGRLQVSLIAQDVDSLAFSKEETLTALHNTCVSIEKGGLTERAFCPTVNAAYAAAVGSGTRTPTPGGGGGGKGGGGGGNGGGSGASKGGRLQACVAVIIFILCSSYVLG